MSGSEHALTFTIRRDGGETRESVVIRHAVIAGWTGSDAAAVEHHIQELEALGIARPASVPQNITVPSSRARPFV